uniref:UPF0481 protein At3g47200 family n=1 Tax=Cajanus cajan TaxID=3821 RepID=A0A151R153_CAJCA|nr:UPF0481 protein At3g47200 family [Cajanus cajan]
MLGSVVHKEVQACSISKVPHKIRKPNNGAYEPKVVSIGPYHRESEGENDLVLMEQPKWKQENENAEESQQGPNVLKICGTTILDLDNIVRASYGGNIQTEQHELAKIILLDGLFLLEFLIRLSKYMAALSDNNYVVLSHYVDDPIFESQEKLLSVLSDMLLLENQIPFIVLKKLYRRLFPYDVPSEEDHRVAELALGALGYPLITPTSGVAHLLHLVHLSITNQEEKHETTHVRRELKRCATRLRANGIKIRPAKRSDVDYTDHLNKFEFGNSFDFEIKFNDKDGVLEIPQLRIKKSTEVKWRNLIAWEQSRIGNRCKLTSYALFFQGMICCPHDIELLEHVGVLVNESKKSNEDLLKLFRTMCEGVEHMDSIYRKDCEKLNKYTATSLLTVLKKWPIVIWHRCRCLFAIILFYWKNWYSILIKEHIPTVWKLIGVLAAIVLLGLTVAQTYYAARSDKKNK